MLGSSPFTSDVTLRVSGRPILKRYVYIGDVTRRAIVYILYNLKINHFSLAQNRFQTIEYFAIFTDLGFFSLNIAF